MTPAQEFREVRDWLAQHKRDPFLWLIILMTLAFATLTFGGDVIFPFSDAKRTIGQALPNADIVVQTSTSCKVPSGTYIFGYDFGVKTDGGMKKIGRICRDVVNGGWVLAFDDPKYLESR